MRRLLLPVALLLAVTAAPSAHAAGGIGIFPSRVEADVHRGGLIPPITVENTSDKPVVVTAQALKATADLSGQPVYDDTPAARRVGDALLRPGPRRFVLRPGARRSVRARVLACPQQGLGTYAVMSFTATQEGGGSGASTIQSALRLTATLLLAYRGGPCLDGRITGLRGEQVGKGRLGFFLRVRNDGELHQLVHAGMAIRHGARTVFRGPFAAENVLPESERELELDLPTRLPAGRYTAVASTKLGPHAARTAWRFRLTGANVLPSPRLSLAPLQVAALHPGEQPQVRATIRNAGSGPGGARVRLSVARIGAGLPLETKLLDVTRVKPGDSRDATARFVSLTKGDYQVGADLIVAGRVVATRRLNVAVTARAGVVDRLRDWVSAHLLLTLLVLVAVAALAAALLVRRLRPRAPVPAAPRPSNELAELRAKLESLEARADERKSA